MKFSLFSDYVYVKVGANTFHLSHLRSNEELTVFATEPFTTTRLLVGNFTNAEKLLAKSLKQLYKNKWFSPSPFIVIQPLEMVEGGLSEVEERAIHELAASAGASRVVVWVGHELSNEEVHNLFAKT